MNISGTWPKAKDQLAYERRIQTQGLAALLEPYRGALPKQPVVVRVPLQRGAMEVRVAA